MYCSIIQETSTLRTVATRATTTIRGEIVGNFVLCACVYIVSTCKVRCLTGEGHMVHAPGGDSLSAVDKYN